MKISCALFLVSCLFLCCSHKDKGPGGILSQKEMTDVMWDLARADQFVHDYVMKDSTKNLKDESVKLYEEIFRLHHINAEQFKKSQAYYQSDPMLFRPIIDSLAKKQSPTTPNFRPIPPDTTFEHIKKPISAQ